ncbi:MAG: hypothetical protein JKY87_06605 [Mariprofundus sp.]|nr:hypothetical protein [Mariprofundus sp.]
MTEKEKQYLEVLMEEMNGKFSLVLEGHDAIRREFSEQLTEVRQKQDMFESLLKFSHDELKEEIQGVRIELKETRGELSAQIEVVGDKVNGMDARDSALGYKVDGHEDRIRLLERKAA